MAKLKELQNKTKDELIKSLKEKRSELVALRFDFSVKKIKDASKMKKVRKDIARVLTIMRDIK